MSLSLTQEELAQVRKYNIHVPKEIDLDHLTNIRSAICFKMFRETEEFKKFERIREEILNRKNVIGIALGSRSFEPILMMVLLEEDEPDFPTEIEGIKVQVRVHGLL